MPFFPGHLAQQRQPGVSQWLGQPETENIPDAFGEDPITAWRAWVAWDNDEFNLHSITYGQIIWPGFEPLKAECRLPTGLYNQPGHESPYKRHQCGIYAVKDIADAEHWAGTDTRGPQILGEVSLWGRVLCFEKGFRAEYAYPYTLYVPDWRGDDASRLPTVQVREKKREYAPHEVVNYLRKTYGVETYLGFPEAVRKIREERKY